MDSVKSRSVAIVGGGIVGLATARALALEHRAEVVVVEAEQGLAQHQTGHNSGVVHSGLYYKPGSLKARNCVEGREQLYRFCEENGIPHDPCGKVVLDRAALKEYEPHVAGVEGLLVPQTGIVDFSGVAEVMARQLCEAGGEVLTGARVTAVQREGSSFVLETMRGEVRARYIVNCGGLQCDRIARMCGLEPDLRIIPFRGEYYKMIPEREGLVRNLIYPVPDPRFPFLGIHFTRMIQGGVEAGPNAILALKREGYGRLSFSARESLDIFSYGGFWRLAASYWSTGMGEVYRSFFKSALVKALQKLIPELTSADIHRHGAGIRAQAVGRDGRLVYDFHILEGECMLHVLNAPSPAATASLCIGSTLAERAARSFDLA
jgi:L-2-hydroxyglutarate oxidase